MTSIFMFWWRKTDILYQEESGSLSSCLVVIGQGCLLIEMNKVMEWVSLVLYGALHRSLAGSVSWAHITIFEGLMTDPVWVIIMMLSLCMFGEESWFCLFVICLFLFSFPPSSNTVLLREDSSTSLSFQSVNFTGCLTNLE